MQAKYHFLRQSLSWPVRVLLCTRGVDCVVAHVWHVAVKDCTRHVLPSSGVGHRALHSSHRHRITAIHVIIARGATWREHT